MDEILTDLEVIIIKFILNIKREILKQLMKAFCRFKRI